MKTIPKTEITVAEILSSCVSNLSDNNLKVEFLNNLNIFEQHEALLEEKIRSLEVYTIGQNIQISNIANETCLKKLYTDKLSKKGQPARYIYDQILFTAPNEKCPYCNQRLADTLDHYIPKANFPIYSISPINLIPACTQCNKGKLNAIPANPHQQTLHPYYDNVEEKEWLECEILQLPEIIFNFKTKNIPDNTGILNQRILNHFDFYKLNALYKSHASSEFTSIKGQITRIFNNKGAAELQDFLFEGYQSRKEADINSWQTAFYKALYENNEFVNGGFI